MSLSFDRDLSCVKMAEPIEMPFGPWTCGSPMNYAFGGGPDPPREDGTLGIMLRHVQTYPQSILGLSTLFVRGMSNAASGYHAVYGSCYDCCKGGFALL